MRTAPVMLALSRSQRLGRDGRRAGNSRAGHSRGAVSEPARAEQLRRIPADGSAARHGGGIECCVRLVRRLHLRRGCAQQGAEVMADKGGTDCAICAEDLQVVWQGRPAAVLPVVPGSLIENRDYAFSPDPRFIWYGPPKARGLLVWGHGKSWPGLDLPAIQPQAHVRAFNNAEFDVVRLVRPPTDYVDGAAEWLPSGLALLRQKGWRMGGGSQPRSLTRRPVSAVRRHRRPICRVTCGPFARNSPALGSCSPRATSMCATRRDALRCYARCSLRGLPPPW
jgi:hypothetical protein